MVVINFEDQSQPGTFEYAIHYLIEHKLDLSVFFPNYHNDQTGRPAYDPAILLKIILFAYSKGITSSREIQWCCETNIIFKALSCDSAPHFTTIASFVSSHASETEALFEQVLLVCDKIKRQINLHLKEHQRLDAMAINDKDHIQRTEQTITTLDQAASKIDAFLERNYFVSI